MLDNFFIKARPIYPNDLIKEMNISLFCTNDIFLEKASLLKITGNSAYRIFVNGKFIGVGPSRSAHNYYRIDEYALKKGLNYLVVELIGYNCNSYYYTNTMPFLQAEIICNGKVLSYTGDDKFICYRNSSKFQKVVRFSYQRTFSESYKFDEDLTLFLEGKSCPYTKIETQILEEQNYLKRNTSYPSYQTLKFKKIEEGRFNIDHSKKNYEDRYMVLEHLKIFSKDEWEVNPNDYISSLVYKKQSIVSLEANCFETYELNVSKTGFLEIDLECYDDSEVYFIFDEIDSSNDECVSILFYRNTTHNIISYELCKGHHKHISFEPYTMKYLRVIVKKGTIKVNNLNLILYENSDIGNLDIEFNSDKINVIKDAAISTFAQNAVDILTDCPSRERAGWLFDSYFTGKAEYLITGKNKVERNFLENYVLLNQYPTLPIGMIPMCYPGEYPDGVFIPNWSLWYILEVYDYYKRTNDKEILDKSKSKIKGLLDYFKKFENELGLLENLESWVFVEWSKANDDDFIKGVNFPSNMLYCRALEVSSEIFDDIELKNKAEYLKKQIIKYSFNGKFFIDNMIRNQKSCFVTTDHITETCQYYAYYFHIVDSKSNKELYHRLIKDFGPNRDYEKVYPNVYKSNVINGYYLRLFILLENNEIELVKREVVDYFYKMANITGTIWEHDSTFASLNHGLTSIVLNIICQIYFGLVSIDFNLKEIILKREVLNENCIFKFNSEEGMIVIENNNGVVKVTKPNNFSIKYI